MYRSRVVLTALLTLLMTGALSVTLAAAQDGTPASSAHDFPLVPDPALCTVEPRVDMDQLLDAWYAEGATPEAENGMVEQPREVTIEIGTTADEATIDQVTSTVHHLFSCFAAGDFARAFSFFTFDLATEFAPQEGETREQAEEFLQSTPVAAPAAEVGMILAITDVTMLDDGRVGAFVVDSSAEGTFTVYVIFEEQEDGTLLIAEVHEFTAWEE